MDKFVPGEQRTQSDSGAASRHHRYDLRNVKQRAGSQLLVVISLF